MCVPQQADAIHVCLKIRICSVVRIFVAVIKAAQFRARDAKASHSKVLMVSGDLALIGTVSSKLLLNGLSLTYRVCRV